MCIPTHSQAELLGRVTLWNPIYIIYILKFSASIRVVHSVLRLERDMHMMAITVWWRPANLLLCKWQSLRAQGSKIWLALLWFYIAWTANKFWHQLWMLWRWPEAFWKRGYFVSSKWPRFALPGNLLAVLNAAFFFILQCYAPAFSPLKIKENINLAMHDPYHGGPQAWTDPALLPVMAEAPHLGTPRREAPAPRLT